MKRRTECEKGDVRKKQATLATFFASPYQKSSTIGDSTNTLPTASTSPESSNAETHVVSSNSISDGKSTKALKIVSTSSCKIRKYDPNYLQFGFTYIDCQPPKPLCVICGESLANDSMKPHNLKRHLNSKHPTLVDKPVDYFKRQRDLMNVQKQCIRTHSATPSNALQASYLVAYRIARLGKPHTIAEQLVLPAAYDICNAMCGPSIASLIKQVPLSDNTVSRRISDMASDVEDRTVESVKQSTCFALQCDETTDIQNMSHLLVFIRYVDVNSGDIVEDFLLCEPLESHTTGLEIFRLINDYMERKDLTWSKCVEVCTDGAKNMSGVHKGLMAEIRKVSPECEWRHCCIHREALVSKALPEELMTVMNNCIKIVNFIKHRALNSRLFRLLCEEMGSEHTALLLHTDIRWLSRGNVLQRLFMLRDECAHFLRNTVKNEYLLEQLNNSKFIALMAYLADIFAKLNELNCSLQGKNLNVFQLYDKLNAFKMKVSTWESAVSSSETSMFSKLTEILEVCDVSLDIQPIIKAHLTQLSDTFEVYFPKTEFTALNKCLWVRNPFFANVTTVEMPIQLKEQLIELNTDTGLRTRFENLSLEQFWVAVREEFPSVTACALRILVRFPSTYLCEMGFSRLVYLKNKFRNRLNVSADLRLQLSSKKPDFGNLSKQAHFSH